MIWSNKINYMNKKIIVILVVVIAVGGVSIYFFKNRESAPEPIPVERTNYIVIVNSDSDFRSEAEKFANIKNAKLLTYSQNFNEVMNELKSKKPIYTAIFVKPEELTPDFVDNIDVSLRDIDADPYLDVAFGIITSRNTTELKKYVDKLLNYVPPQKMKIYAVAPKYTYRNLEPDFGIDIKHHCLTNCGGGLCICDNENRATLARIQNNIKNANIFVINAHGTPSSIQLDNSEYIEGSSDGIYGSFMNKKLDLSHNAVLSIAESCATGRINGKPKITDARYEDTDVTGQIDTSLVLSFLQSGTLNYLASTHVANGAIDPEETFIEESFLQKIPIGVALKDLKNRYIMVTEKYKVAMPRSPVNTDEFTKDFILFQVRNWILFGDPSIILSNEQYKPISCIKSYSEEQIGNKKEVEIQIQFRSDRLVENSQYIDKMEKENAG